LIQEAELFDVLRQGLWVGVKMSAPILITALVVGISVGLVQALTSIQEMTLTFVPKLAAMVAVFWATMGFMTMTLTVYFSSHVIPLVRGF